MPRIHINADAGEGSPNSPLDLRLICEVDAVNICLGAHAGSAQWTRELCHRAIDAGCSVHLHPSYPDREGFGRRSLSLAWSELSDSLHSQRDVLPDVHVCKFHGALYNDACRDAELSERLVHWAAENSIDTLLAPADSLLYRSASAKGIRVLREGFADRRYESCEPGRNPSRSLELVSRSEAEGVIKEPELAAIQAAMIALDGRVQLRDGTFCAMAVDTICVHGDGETPLETVRAIRSEEERRGLR